MQGVVWYRSVHCLWKVFEDVIKRNEKVNEEIFWNESFNLDNSRSICLCLYFTITNGRVSRYAFITHEKGNSSNYNEIIVRLVVRACKIMVHE